MARDERLAEEAGGDAELVMSYRLALPAPGTQFDQTHASPEHQDE